MNARKILALLIGIAVIIVGVVLYQNRQIFTAPNSIVTRQSTVTIDNHTFTVLVARTMQQKVVGLSQRNELDQNMGMLFPFDHPDYYGFWMKDMKFPLDFIYITNSKIVTIVNDLPTPTANQVLPIFKPTAPADTVLEINAGISRKFKFKVGDLVTFAL